MTTRRSTKTTTRRAERKCSSSSSSSAFCDACVYIIKSLTEVLFNNNRGNSVTKQISLVVLSRPVRARSGARRSKNLKPEIAQIYIRSLSFASKSDWFFQLIRHFSSASNLNQNILLLCISYITEEISDDRGRGGVRKWARDTWTATPIVAREKVDERKQRCWTRDDWCTSNRGIANFGGEFTFF